MDFNQIIDQLKQKRPVFQSEDDLKLAADDVSGCKLQDLDLL